jgi:reactive intermediate/imine deaminase
MKGIVTKPDPYKPYLLSQAVNAGPYLFVSGQAGYDDDGKIVAGGFLAQGNQAFRNLDRALKAGGSSLDHVVKVTIFVTDIAQFRHVVELRREHFSEPYPADTIVEINALYTPDAMIEIEAVALAA